VKKQRSKSAAAAVPAADSAANNGVGVDEEFQPPPLRPTESRVPHRPYRRHDSVERGFLNVADDRPLLDASLQSLTGSLLPLISQRRC
jgi:hypothetical protein